MDEREIEKIRKEAARQAAVGASGEKGAIEREEPADMPKHSLAEEGRTAPEEEGERQPHATGDVPTASTTDHPGSGPAVGEPARKASGGP